jgi:glycosyltransferase involved in cell wall biosynthesis
MITVWTTVFGNYHHFVDEWLDSVVCANPDRVLVVSDRSLNIDAEVLVAEPIGPHPEAVFRNIACRHAENGWLWQIDVDDRILPDALSVLDGRDCDVVQVGLVAMDNENWKIIPSVRSNADYLSNDDNSYTAGSPFTKDVWERAGGFPYIGYNDYGFWRRCARIDAKFEFANKVCYMYRTQWDDSLTGKNAQQNKHNIRKAMVF